MITKLCAKHGELTVDKLYKRKTLLSKNKKGYRYECHYCRIESANKQNQKKEVKRYHKKRAIDLMLDHYIRDRLMGDGFAREDITPELMDAKRAMLSLYRKIREINTSGQTQQSSSK